MTRSDRSLPVRTLAIRIQQPLGEFYAVSLPARLLLEVTFSNPLKIEEIHKAQQGYSLSGTQRAADASRFKDIGNYLNSSEAAFPNSIILGANYSDAGDFLGDPGTREYQRKAWRIEKEKGQIYLVIPSFDRMAAIIDGQHRLRGFEYASDDRLDMHLLCAVYLDLPIPFQAYLFATINFNQKKVDKSLAYELFGFDVEDEPADTWPPEKMAVFLCRRLNVDPKSPLYGNIKVVAENREALDDEATDRFVSTATVVEGLLSLFSAKPKADRDKMCTVSVDDGRTRASLKDDGTPLRELYLTGEDKIVYTIVNNYFSAVASTLWNSNDQLGYIRKTVGVQALFDVLRKILPDRVASKKVSTSAFESVLKPASQIDFTDDFFQASGKGRVRIRNVLLLKMKEIILADLGGDDMDSYRRLAK